MINRWLKLQNRGYSTFTRWLVLLLAAISVLASLSSIGCNKKAKARPAISGPIRVVILPFAVQDKDKDLQWIAMAAPAMIAKACSHMPDLAVVPFWDAMPPAIASAGAARSFNDESASSLANWVGAKWAIMGEISRTKTSYSLTVDFIPTRGLDVPFRYIKTKHPDNMGIAFQSAIHQWFRYTTAKRILAVKQKDPGLNKMRSIAEALDQEYGWFETASPGNAQKVVDALSPADKEWAGVLFNPTMYPQLSKTGN
jgi:hypothetical protein